MRPRWLLLLPALLAGLAKAPVSKGLAGATAAVRACEDGGAIQTPFRVWCMDTRH